jgi:hypothetical protein
MTDLVLRGGRIIDPASGRDETADIAFGDRKVNRNRARAPAKRRRDRRCTPDPKLIEISNYRAPKQLVAPTIGERRRRSRLQIARGNGWPAMLTQRA